MIGFLSDIEFKDIIFAITSTAIGIYFTIRYTQKRELLFIENKCNWLGKKEFEYLLTIKNSGNVDIDKTIVHTPISISLPKDYLVKSTAIIKKPEDLKVSIKSNKDLVQFNWDLLKKQEFFQIKIVISYVKPNKELNSGFDIIHNYLKKKKIRSRITDLRYKEEVIPYNFKSDEVFSIYIGGHHELFFVLLLFVFLGFFGYILITDYAYFYFGFILIISSLFLSYIFIRTYALYMKKAKYLFEIEDIEYEDETTHNSV